MTFSHKGAKQAKEQFAQTRGEIDSASEQASQTPNAPEEEASALTEHMNTSTPGRDSQDDRDYRSQDYVRSDTNTTASVPEQDEDSTNDFDSLDVFDDDDLFGDETIDYDDDSYLYLLDTKVEVSDTTWEEVYATVEPLSTSYDGQSGMYFVPEDSDNLYWAYAVIQDGEAISVSGSGDNAVTLGVPAKRRDPDRPGLIIDKSVAIIGEKERATIDLAGDESIYITAKNVMFKNVTFTRTNYAQGGVDPPLICVCDGGEVILEDCTLQAAQAVESTGLLATGKESNVICCKTNFISATSAGALVTKESYAQFDGCIFSENQDGVRVAEDGGFEVTRSFFTSNHCAMNLLSRGVGFYDELFLEENQTDVYISPESRRKIDKIEELLRELH